MKMRKFLEENGSHEYEKMLLEFLVRREGPIAPLYVASKMRGEDYGIDDDHCFWDRYTPEVNATDVYDCKDFLVSGSRNALVSLQSKYALGDVEELYL